MKNLEPLPGKKELMLFSLNNNNFKERGFSLLEMAVVLAIALVMMSVAMLSLRPALKDVHINQAYNSTLAQIRGARERAVEGRQQYIVCLGTHTPSGAATPMGTPTAQSVSVFQWPSGTALSAAVEISQITLPSDVQFLVISGIPTSAATVPDGFGTGNVALAFDQGVAGGAADQIMFQPDGSARDTNGNLNNGVLYMARSGELYSSRAISLFGASGRVRGWRLVNSSGTATWIQQ
jgi:prepilin-type N-terminal cleavage/methylation domain-containing protein